MDVLIHNATIIDTRSAHHNQVMDVLVEDGVVAGIGKSIRKKKAVEVWQAEGNYLSVGWTDIGAQVGEPGLEHRENLKGAAAAAAAGGYTAVGCFPNTRPVLHSKTEIHYILKNSEELLVDFFPIGAVSTDCNGKDIAEILDMYSEGAVAFSDGEHSIQHAGLMQRALLYVKSFHGLIMNHPMDTSIAAGGQMHEGMVSTSLGLKGIPSHAEELMLQRDIRLLEYTGSRLHAHNISTKESVDLVRQAKKKGLSVTASVAAANLFFDDAALQSFDTYLKVIPPLRSASDKQALIDGVVDGTIDCICSNHVPLEIEKKKLEFPYADFGMIGLETTFSVANTVLADYVPLDKLVSMMALQPRKIFGLPLPVIEQGQPANLVLFDPTLRWTPGELDFFSHSNNTAFLGIPLLGRVSGVINRDKSIRFYHS